MKIAVIGSRDFKSDKHYEFMVSTLGSFGFDKDGNEIVSGGAKGADTLAKYFSEDADLGYKEFAPDWEKHGKGAAFIRNRQIVEYSDFIVCYWDGTSKGTENSISMARELGKPTLIFYF
jgi:predicted Rossmann fold nucleotide-binding protein DprA/Smf involved in DNA uptake